MFYGHEHEFKSIEQLRGKMIKYIHYYNNSRIMVKLGGKTPCQVREEQVA